MAAETSSPLLVYGRDWHTYEADGLMVFEAGGKRLVTPLPRLIGAHQILNAGAALMTLRVAVERIPVGDKAQEEGLQRVVWPGRLQRLSSAALGLPEETEVWLDSGHNDSAGEILARQIQRWAADDPKPVHLVLGMLGHKDVRGFLQPLAPFIDRFSLVGIPGEKNVLTAEILAEKAGSLSLPALQGFHENPQALFKSLEPGSSEPRRVLIAGSVYLAGAVLDLEQRAAFAKGRV